MKIATSKKNKKQVNNIKGKMIDIDIEKLVYHKVSEEKKNKQWTKLIFKIITEKNLEIKNLKINVKRAHNGHGRIDIKQLILRHILQNGF